MMGNLQGTRDHPTGSILTVSALQYKIKKAFQKLRKALTTKPEIGFDFPAGSKPPLEIRETYLFKAVYDRHGIRYTEWTKMKKKPNP
jgi:hypothetical protein